MWPLGGGKCGKGGEMYKERGKCNIEPRIEFPDPKFVTLDTPNGPSTKFLKKCLKNAGKIQACMPKIREISLKTKSEGTSPPHPLYGNVDIPL